MIGLSIPLFHALPEVVTFYAAINTYGYQTNSYRYSKTRTPSSRETKTFAKMGRDYQVPVGNDGMNV